MRTALAATAGASTALGLLMIALGFLPAPRTRPGRVRRPTSVAPSGGWSTWRWAVAAVGGGVVWAVTGWPVAGGIAAVTVVGLPVLLSTGKVATARIDRVEAIEEWSRRLGDVLLTGVGLEQAIATTARSVPAPIATEVRGLEARLGARWSTEDVLRAFADDLDCQAGDLLVAALLLGVRRRGPGLARVLVSVADTLAEEVAVARRIEAERAKPRTTARAVTFITLGVAAAGLANPAYLAPYGDGLGQVILAAIAAVFVGCLAWMRRLTLPAPEPRFIRRAAP
ncbi:MAG: type II secretion system F family protein [Actinomycetales bacterium]|nr:type II secretion system F family protein [Actinomycetales bacterium]